MRPMRRSLLLLSCVAALAGCPQGVEVPDDPPQAPQDLDDLVHFFWTEMAGEDAELVAAGGANLASWYDGSTELIEGWFMGMVSDLDSDEIGLLDGMTWEPDPADTAGVLIVVELGCSLQQTMEIYLEPDQLSLFPDSYASYERFFDSDPGCFADGSCDQVDWHSEISDSIADLYYLEYGMTTRLRRFGDDGAILARNYMPSPAEDDVEAAGFEQSYHIEAYVPRSAGRTLHLYGLWNHGYLEDVPPDVPFWTDQYLEGLVEWDERVGELCEEGW